MFKRDQSLIEMYAKQSPKHTEMVCAFVIASIRTHTSRLPKIMNSYRKRGRNGLSELMPRQQEGILYARKHRQWLFNLVERYRAGGITTEETLLELMTIPCIGLVKAGFLLQCLTGTVGCLDCHNLRKNDMPENAFNMSHNRVTDANLRKVRRYVQTCEELGGSEVLWNEWCDAMADRYTTFQDGNAVSFLHSQAIAGIN
jgi:hypothetical protein